ncbi:hypothetical protein RFI_22020, partial [Reticulomyxa filosa]
KNIQSINFHKCQILIDVMHKILFNIANQKVVKILKTRTSLKKKRGNGGVCIAKRLTNGYLALNDEFSVIKRPAFSLEKVLARSTWQGPSKNQHSGKHNIYKQLRQAKPPINTNLGISINLDNISIINVYINNNWIETMNKEPVQLSDKILKQRLDITVLPFGKYCYENDFDCSTIYNHASLYIQY